MGEEGDQAVPWRGDVWPGYAGKAPAFQAPKTPHSLAVESREAHSWAHLGEQHTRVIVGGGLGVGGPRGQLLHEESGKRIAMFGEYWWKTSLPRPNAQTGLVLHQLS